MNVVHTERNGSTYADVASIGGIPKGSQPPKLEGEPVYLSLDPEDFEPETFDSLSDKLKEIIIASPEYEALLQTSSEGSAEDESGAPF